METEIKPMKVIKPKTLSEDQENALRKYKVIVYHYDGYSNTQISNMLNVQLSTIRKWIKKFNEYGDVLKVIAKSRPPSKVIDEIKKEIEKKIEENPKILQKELVEILKNKFNVDLNTSTISRTLATIGTYKNPQKIPLLSNKNKEKRINYAKVHLNDKFTNVIFSDESRFELCPKSRKIFVLKGHETPQIEIKNPNPSVMVWGAICRKGRVALTFIDKTMNKHVYIDTLNKHLLPNANKIYGQSNWRFQQDNVPCHKAYMVRDWLWDNNIRLLEHPPQSPDLNPIELIWAIMKNELEKTNPANIKELKNNIAALWDTKISVDFCNNCILHLIKILPKVLELQGNFVK